MDDIKPIPSVKPERYGESYIPPHLPQGSALFIAPSNSGKTTLMVNLILRRRFGIIITYSEIHIISPTVFMDDNWEMLRPPHYKRFKIKIKGKKFRTADIQVHDNYDTQIIQDIMDAQEAKTEKSRRRILIILDDIADSIVNSPILDRLFFRGRHVGVFCWISSQMYKKVPRSIRVNVPYYIFFRVNTNELGTIADELAIESKKEFMSIFTRATERQYSFLCINAKKTQPGSGRYMSNFIEIN